MQGFMVGVAIGFITFAAFIEFTPSYHNRAKVTVEKCENNIPRNQHCVIIAVPDIKKN